MRSVTVMEAQLDWESLDAIELEAQRAGVPVEYYFVEGWRRAFWDAMKERDAAVKEREAEDEAEFHRAVDRGVDAYVERLKANLARRHGHRRASA